MKEKKISKIFFFLLFLFPLLLWSQEKRGDIRIMFYNVENLFDTENDPHTNDDEYTPEGSRHWTKNRYQNKLNNLFKVIANAGIWSPPEIIGLCEIENRKVLSDLINETPIYKYNFGIIHFESPDSRGIDVACLYNQNKLSLIQSTPLPVIDTENISFKTRDILYISFLTNQKDTLHIYINHWPSRRGGQDKSDDKRNLASNVLLNHINSLFYEKKPNVIIMGDFNDEPQDRSIQNLILSDKLSLINLTNRENKTIGTIKYLETWNIFDQIIVSSSFMNKQNKLNISSNDFHILDFDYLLIDDTSYAGKKNFKTYNGYQYLGGFSDHLPVIVDIWY